MFGEQPADKTASSSSSPAPPRRALLVDDIDYHLEWLAELLRPLGFDSTYALNIAEAKKALSSLAFDVVFLDCELPDGAGHVLAAEMHDMGLAQMPSIIGMTASNDDNTMLRFFAAGAEAFMRKPISFDLVCDTLRKCELLDPHKTYEEPARPKLDFNNIHFMSQGDKGRFQAYLKRISSQLETEIGALVVACKEGQAEVVRAIVHRLLSLTPLLESREFTNVLQSCQRVASWQDRQLLRELGQAVEWEYRLVKASLQDELDRCQQAQSLWLCKSD